jgi:hypothetical protein
VPPGLPIHDYTGFMDRNGRWLGKAIREERAYLVCRGCAGSNQAFNDPTPSFFIPLICGDFGRCWILSNDKHKSSIRMPSATVVRATATSSAQLGSNKGRRASLGFKHGTKSVSHEN